MRVFAGNYKNSSVTAIALNFHEFTGEVNPFVMLEGHLKSCKSPDKGQRITCTSFCLCSPCYPARVYYGGKPIDYVVYNLNH